LVLRLVPFWITRDYDDSGGGLDNGWTVRQLWLVTATVSTHGTRNSSLRTGLLYSMEHSVWRRFAAKLPTLCEHLLLHAHLLDAVADVANVAPVLQHVRDLWVLRLLWCARLGTTLGA
jgi:hypothetical protein